MTPNCPWASILGGEIKNAKGSRYLDPDSYAGAKFTLEELKVLQDSGAGTGVHNGDVVYSVDYVRRTKPAHKLAEIKHLAKHAKVSGLNPKDYLTCKVQIKKMKKCRLRG